VQVSAKRNTTELYDRVIASCWTDTQVADIGRFLNITVKQKLGNAPKKGTPFVRVCVCACVRVQD
jgi:hypothetical protein